MKLCLLTADFFFRRVLPCEFNIERAYIVILCNTVTPVDQLQRQMGVRFISTWYYTRPGVGILARKNSLVMNWYSFLGHEYSFFNAIGGPLIALKTSKSLKSFLPCPLKVHQGSAPDPKLQLRLIRNHFFPYKTQSSSTKRALVKALG